MHFNWFTIVLLISVSQGVFLILSLNTRVIKNQANPWLTALLITIVLSLSLRLIYVSDYYYEYPHLANVTDFVMFVFGPVLYFYINKLLYKEFEINHRQIAHFIPLFFFMISMVYLLTLSSRQLLELNVAGQLDGYYGILLATAIVQNAVYVFMAIKEFESYKIQYHESFSDNPTNKYLKTILSVMLFCICLWLIGFILSYFSFPTLTNSSYQIAFIGLSLLTFVIGFYAINYPDAIQMIKPLGKATKYQGSNLDKEELNVIKQKLERILNQQKTFLESKLSLSKLAELVDTSPVYLSRVINESYEKNFFDFINDYRVNEFISKVLSEKYENYTYLGVALESGFNTKTTFNKAFKKATGITPKEYFKKAQLLMEDLRK